MKCEKCGNEYPSQYFFVTHNLCKNCFEQLSSEEQQKILAETYQAYPPVNYMNRVGFGKRLLAALVDYMILILIILGVFSFTGFFGSLQKFMLDVQSVGNNIQEITLLQTQFMSDNMNSIIFNSIITIAYYSLEMLIGATLGKLILGIQIAKSNGKRSDFMPLFIRFLVKNASNLFGFLAILTAVGAFDLLSFVCLITVFIGFFCNIIRKKTGFA